MTEKEVERRMRKVMGNDTYDEYQKAKEIGNRGFGTSIRVNQVNEIESRVRSEVKRGVNTLRNDDE